MSIITHSNLGKVTAVVVGISVAVAVLIGTTAVPAQAQATLDEGQIQSILTLLTSFNVDQATINNVNSALRGQPTSGTSGGTGTGYVFNTNLKQGDTGEDARQLQIALNSLSCCNVAGSGAGSPGSESSFFGSLTKAAVVKFQNTYASDVLTPLGLSAGTGFFGPSSRAKLNDLMVSTGTTTPPPPTTGGGTPVGIGNVSVFAATTQPVNGLAPVSAARVPFTRITLTAGLEGATIDSVTVKRGPTSQNTDFASVVLLDENGIQIGNSKTFNSLNMAVLSENFQVAPNTSMTVTVAGNIASGAGAGNVASVSVQSVEVVGGTAVGVFPITGALHTVNSVLSLGTASIRTSSQTDLSTSEEVGKTDHVFAGIRITAGSVEPVLLHSITFNQSGSAAASDLANVAILVNGVSYVPVVSSDNYTGLFKPPVSIAKGGSSDVVIRADIVGGSSRNVIFDIEKSTDIYVSGADLGYGITPTAAGTAVETTTGQQMSSAAPPFYDGVTVSINAGSVSTVSNYSALGPATNVALNVTETVLGAYQTNILGEPISVGTTKFYIGKATTSASITNISLYDENGNVVAAGVDTSGSTGLVTFSDSITYPTGISRYVLKGTISSSIGGWVSGNTIVASTTPSTDWTQVTGETTGDTISLSALSSPVAMNTQTIRTGSLKVSVSSQPVAQNVIGGASQFEFARYILDAGSSGEDIRLTTLPLSYLTTSSNRNDLAACYLYDDATQVSRVKNPASGDTASSTTLTFANNGYVVPKGTVKTLSLKCDVVSGATSKYYWGLDSGQQTAYTGATGLGSNTTIAETLIDATGQKMTGASSGSYTVTNDTSILYRVVKAGTADAPLAKFRFEASVDEDLNIQQVAFELGNTASNSQSDLLGEQVTLWNDSGVQIGTASFATGDNATSTLLSPALFIKRGEVSTLTVKGSLQIHDQNNGTPGAFLSITYDAHNNGVNGNYAKGVASQGNINGSTSADVTTNGVRIFRNVPALSDVTTTSSLVTGSDLYAVRVTAPAGRDILLDQLTFEVTTNWSTDELDFKLYGPAGAVNATKVSTSTVSGISDALVVNFDDTATDRIIQGGSSKTYTLRIENAIEGVVAANTETLTIRLLSDTAYPSLKNNMGDVTEVTAGLLGRIVWSPNSTTTAVSTAAKNENRDWTNSYGIPGFPTLGQNMTIRAFSD